MDGNLLIESEYKNGTLGKEELENKKTVENQWKPKDLVHATAEKDLPVKHKIRGYFEWNGLPFWAKHFPDRLDLVEEYKFGEGDVLVWTYPKSGTHFCAALLFDIMRTFGKPFVNQKMYPLDLGKGDPKMDTASPKVLYSHLPWSQLPKQVKEGKVKVVSALREPKAVCTSYYAFLKEPIHFTMPIFEPTDTSIDEFINEIFIEGRSAYGGYFNWLRHWYGHRDDDYLLTLRFDDLKLDNRSCIVRMCEHIGVTLTEEQIDLVVENNQFSRKKREEKDPFQQKILRKGEIDGWKNELTEKQISKLDDWISKSMVGLEEIYDMQSGYKI